MEPARWREPLADAAVRHTVFMDGTAPDTYDGPMVYHFRTTPTARRRSRLADVETPEQTVEQAIASGRLEGAPEPTPQERQQLLAIARGEVSADDVVAEIVSRYV